MQGNVTVKKERQIMTETRRLYYEDVYKKEFTATVVECREQKKGYVVILDESAFYPEGGGQPSDVGTLGDAKVTEVHEKDGELLHYTDKALEVGAKVEGKIDWARRFDLMQQHSGEHMVSGIIHEKYGYDNVGFHMGSDVITVDLNGMLDDAQLAEIEREVNERVWEDKEVVITYPDAEELKTIDYRSKKELTGQVRIVTFPGVDVCACCGTHVTHTGEIGMVKLLSVVKFHDGIRMEMICGKRVLDYLNMVNEQNHQIPQTLIEECGMYLNVISPIDNVSCYILRNIPAAHSFDRKPHGQKTVRIFPEYFTVHKVTPAADDLSKNQPRHTQISQPERLDLLDLTI